MSTVYKIDPLEDPRWQAFLQRHPQASIFHTAGWLEALRRTYGYEPSVLTMSGPDSDLTNGLVFCHVRSWLTGQRFVSLPFSDHCELLASSPDDVALLIAGLQRHANEANCRYLELRPITTMYGSSGLGRSTPYYLHRLDLRPGAPEVFQAFHRDCIQRKIRRAEREALTIREGRTPDILEQFYSLAVRTRRRQRLPPQPFLWFNTLVDSLGPALNVRIASKNDQPIAGIITLQHKDRLTYKYGASDERFHNLGGMIYLFWIAIQDAISCGLTELDMGRSAIDNPGLVAFKDHWGASRSTLSYWRFPVTRKLAAAASWESGLLRRACGHLPDRFLISLGTRLYRHVG